MGVEIRMFRDWADPQWLREVHEWIRDEVPANGFGQVHSITQTHVRAWSTVMRIESPGGTIWFKANSEGARHEAELLTAMSRWSAGSVPEVIATEPVAGWFLARDSGLSLAHVLEADPDLGHWERALVQYGALQRRLAPHTQDMLRMGVPDCRPQSMPALLGELLDDTEACCLGEPGGMSPDSHARLGAFLPEFGRLCDRLDGFGVASTLQHDDLHRSNIFQVADGHAFLDWADASVAHPFGSLIYPMLQAAELPGPPDARRLERFRDAYLEPWTDVLDRKTLREAADLSVRVASVGRAMVWRRAVRAAERVALKEYYATGTPRWLQKLLDE